MKNTIIPMLVFSMVLGINTAYAEATYEAEAKLQQLQQALALHPEDGNLIKKVGLAFYKAGKYAEAEVLLKKSMAQREQEFGGNHPNFATAMNDLAELYRAQGRYALAEPLFQKSLAIYGTALDKNHSVIAISLNNLAAVYYAQAKYAQAEPLYLRSLAIDEENLGKTHPDVATDLNNLAQLYQSLGKYPQAESLLLRGLAIYEQTFGKNSIESVVSLNNLASLYQSQAKYLQAAALYKRSLAIAEHALGKNHPDVAQNLSTLATLYKAQGQYEQAEPLYIRSSEIREKSFGNDSPNFAKALNDLALLYYAQGKFSQAQPLLEKSLAIREKTLADYHPDVAESLGNLAMLYEVQTRYTDAEFLLQKSLAINETAFGREHPVVATDLNNLAFLYQKQGKYAQAEPLSEKSLAMREKTLGMEHPDVAVSLNNLAALKVLLGNYRQAEVLYRRSLAISEQSLGQAHPQTSTTLNNLALSYLAQHNDTQAAPLLQRSLRMTNQALEGWLWGAGEKTRQAYLQQQEVMKNYYLSFYSLANQPEEALYFSLSRKGLLLRISSEISALAKQSTNPAIQKQTQEFNALKAQLSSLVLMGKANPEQIRVLEEKNNTLEMQLSQNVSGFKRGKTDVTPTQVLKKLSPQQTLVDFLIYHEADFKTQQYKSEQLIALITNKDSGIKLIKLGELAPISEAIKSYRQTILPTAQGQLANRAEVLNPASQKLYELLWQPLLPYLASKKEVFLIPDGILHLLPFKALQDKQGHYLVENQQITVLSSARDIVLPPLTGKKGDAVIFAAPAFGEKDSLVKNQPTRAIAIRQQDIYFAPLEGAAAEGQALSQLIKVKQPIRFFQGNQVNEATVAAIRSPRLLHFATHGFFLENLPHAVAGIERGGLIQESAPNIEKVDGNSLTRSGLALTGANFGIAGKKQADGTDGILTALEVLALHLEGTDLVTLSACETGVGEIQVGEGVYSLNRAFQEAGAKSVLSTLWSVADDQTKLFMQNFYTLVLNGDTPQQALQKTQLKFIKDKNLQDPFFWAAFTVVGI